MIEGELPTDSLEREAPFGEAPGYMGMKRISPYFNVTCITHRKNPIYNAFISQMPPSESTVIEEVADYHLPSRVNGSSRKGCLSEQSAYTKRLSSRWRVAPICIVPSAAAVYAVFGLRNYVASGLFLGCLG